MATSVPKMLYQTWKGSNKFFCGGRLIFGPDAASLLLTTVLIAGPSLAFCCQVISKMSHHTVLAKNNVLSFPVLFITIMFTIMNLAFLFMTSGRDPGIVPRNSLPPDPEAYDITTPSMEWISGRTPHLRLPRTKDVDVNGFIVKVKFCDTCLLYRPPRASHCSICNNCVQRFDHHCPWVGQCIGLRNYRFFFLFISSSAFLCLYVFTVSWMNIVGQKKHYGSIWRSMKGEVLSLVLIVYTFIAVWFVGGLTVFHLYLSSTNQTTYENFRYRYDKRENPYNKGTIRNFKELFLSKIPSSMNDFRSWVFEESSEVELGSPDIGMDMNRQKEKIDNEWVDKPAPSGNTSVPFILQNLDYNGINEDSDNGSKHLDSTTDPLACDAILELPDQGQGNDNENCREAQAAEIANDSNDNEAPRINDLVLQK